MKRPIIALSPMADMTDSAFCRIAKRHGAPVVFREMISTEGLVHGSVRSLTMGAFEEEERPIIQQLFGADPASMAEATRIIDQAYSPDGFDINMGCPVYKIVSNFNGAALMKEPKLAADIIKKMREATDKPVSVKVRLGWSKPTEALDFVKVVEAAGAALVTIHGRTKEQGYRGVADWEMIGRAKQQVSIPVLCNGDITSGQLATEALKISGCEGVLIARGALGNPWIFSEIEATLANKDYTRPSLDERVRIVLEHARLHAAQYATPAPLTTFRKHLSWYFKGVPGVKPFKERLMKASTVEELEGILEELKMPAPQ